MSCLVVERKWKETTGKRFSLVWLQKENEKKIMKSTLTGSCSFSFSSAIFSVSRLLFDRFLYITFLFSLRGGKKKKFLFSFFVCFPEVPYMALTLARACAHTQKRKIQSFHQMWIIPSIITSKMQKYTKSSMWQCQTHSKHHGHT